MKPRETILSVGYIYIYMKLVLLIQFYYLFVLINDL